VINEIARNDKYKNFCKKITNHNSLWEDLYQELMLKAIENQEKLRSLNTDEIDLYLWVVAYDLWNHPEHGRGKVKKHKVGTSPFYSMSDNPYDLDDYFENQKAQGMNQAEKDIRVRLVRELNAMLNSDNVATKRQGELLKKYCEGMNRLNISKETGINYKIVHNSIEEAKIKIKQNMGFDISNKTQINIKLRNEAVVASYSGKDKTFYVSKEPSEALKETITKSGFKICKK
jgi:DNA-directed RNA polymerase specialized sigma24 family protein